MVLAYMPTQRWIVAITQPNRERWALENIDRQNYEFYLPRVAERVRAARRISEFRTRPLFPRHIFVRIVDRWHSLLSTHGVRGVIMFGENLAVVPEKDIQRIRAMEDEKGLVVLPQLRKGQKVLFRRGSFAGQSGLYQGQSSQDRCKVLLAYLGRMVPVLVESSILEAA
jgi:transcription antitermination factor NusG